LPVRSHSIDIITAAGSLNYADLSLFFLEAVRVLAPDGVLAMKLSGVGQSRYLVQGIFAPIPAAVRLRSRDQPAYLDYVMTETNVAHAVRTGVPEREIRAWCAGTLARPGSSGTLSQ